jgi:GNAT superfamily N-acetyltransferase
LVREILESDIPALFVVRPQTRENAMSLEELASIGITHDSMKAAIKGSHRGWLFEDDGEVVGFAMGDSDKAELTVMAMLPAHEGKGIGGKLLTRVESWLESEGCKKIWLTTDINPSLRAYGFYLKHGWEDWKIEHDLRFMTRVLSQ